MTTKLSTSPKFLIDLSNLTTLLVIFHHLLQVILALTLIDLFVSISFYIVLPVLCLYWSSGHCGWYRANVYLNLTKNGFILSTVSPFCSSFWCCSNNTGSTNVILITRIYTPGLLHIDHFNRPHIKPSRTPNSCDLMKYGCVYSYFAKWSHTLFVSVILTDWQT